jgi:hypothetical protein
MGADGNLESGSCACGQKIPQVREISFSVAAVKQKKHLADNVFMETCHQTFQNW